MANLSTALSTTIASWIPRLSLAAGLVLLSLRPSLAQTVEIVRPLQQNDEGQITLRLRVEDANNRPVIDLNPDNFALTIDETPLEFSPNDWKSPQEAEPPPAWIVVLVDFSGSMNQLDSRGTTRIEGAMTAIEELVNSLQGRASETQVAVVPFGVGGKGCEGYEVTPETLDKFFTPNSALLANYLDSLATKTPCTSTNIYEPLTQAIWFLSNPNDERFTVSNRKQQSRLGIILLSDGFHNTVGEAEDFERLISLIQRTPTVTVHTVGYGLTPEKLAQKYGLNRPATRQDISEGRIPEEEFVDQDRLQSIADTSGGISVFSASSLEVSRSFNLFLDALLGEYQITYMHPQAERGSKHQVKVDVEIDQSTKVTDQANYTITIFGRSLPRSTRLIMMLIVLCALGLGGILPFFFWAGYLKRSQTNYES
jgi:hypothetical protein